MQVSGRCQRVAAAGATAVLLLLGGPGVTTLRAEEPLVPALPPGPVCRADAPPADPQLLADTARRLAERAQEPGADQVIALDNRGYNYGEGPGPGLGALQRELMQLHRESGE